MKKIFFVSVTIITLVLSSACTSSHYTSRNAKYGFVPTELTTTYVDSDLDVKEKKVTGSCSAIGASKVDMENNAMADALEKCGGDIIIEPRFTYEYIDGQLRTVTVTGYPGYYRNFRKHVPAVVEQQPAQPNGPQVVVYGAEINNHGAPAHPATDSTKGQKKR